MRSIRFENDETVTTDETIIDVTFYLVFSKIQESFKKLFFFPECYSVFLHCFS